MAVVSTSRAAATKDAVPFAARLRAPLRVLGLVVALLAIIDIASASIPKGLEKYDPKRIPKISLVTVGQGPSSFDRFGQSALRIRVENERTDRFYTFCVVDAAGTSWADMLRGRMRYRLAEYPYALAIAHFQDLRREVVEQDLAPIVDGAYSLASLLADPANPDREGYTLDFFRTNCTTKVRDLIDQSVSGRLRETWKLRDSQTIRQHVLRMSADAVVAYVALDFLLGPAADVHPSKWDAAFLPQMLQRALEGVRFEGAHGVATLVKESRRVVEGPLERIRHKAPDRAKEIWRGNVIAVVVVLVLGSLAFGGGRAARVAFSVAVAGWGLAAGLLGSASAVLGLFSNSPEFGRNVNLLAAGPWALALPALAVGVHRGTRRALDVCLWVCTASAVGSCLAFGISKLPSVAQDSDRVVALVLPLWLAFGYSIAKLRFPRLSPLWFLERATGDRSRDSESS